MACCIFAWGGALALAPVVAAAATLLPSRPRRPHLVGPEDAGAVVPPPLGPPVGEPNLLILNGVNGTHGQS